MKTVELIAANLIYDIADKIAMLDPVQRLAWEQPEQSRPALEHQLRQLLCNLSHSASIAVVQKALTAAGAPATVCEIEQRVEAAREVQAREAAP